MRLLRHDLHALAGAYALDAIDRGAERERFTRHMNGCPTCAGEVRGFREVATAMAFAATLEPPPALRAEVLAAVARTRQLPPEIRTHARPKRNRTWVPWVPWLSGAIATAGIVIAVLFGFAQAHTQQELNQARAQSQSLAAIEARTMQELDQARNQNQLLAAIMAAPHVRVLSQRSTKGGVAVVLLASVRHQLIVTTTGLPGAARREGVPALADREEQDRVGGPAARGQVGTDRPRGGLRAAGRGQARPDRRARPRDDPPDHEPDHRADRLGVRGPAHLSARGGPPGQAHDGPAVAKRNGEPDRGALPVSDRTGPDGLEAPASAG